MRMSLDKCLFYHFECNTLVCQFNERDNMLFPNVSIQLITRNTSLNKNYVAHSITVV